MLIVVTLIEQNQRLDLFYKSTFMFVHIRFAWVFCMMESFQVLSDSSPKYENCYFMFHRKKDNTIQFNIFFNRLLQIIDHERCLFVEN